MIAFGLIAIASYLPNFAGPRPSPTAADIAFSDAKNLETAIMGIMSDAGCGLNCLFVPDAVTARRADLIQRGGLNEFEASVRIYSTVMPALLERGKNAASVLTAPDVEGVLDREVVARLGSSYMELREDPWGQPYQFFFGPWPKEWGPPVFRVYGDPEKNHVADSLTVTRADGTRVGFPADATLPIYVWSLGANGVSDQARFDPSGAYAGAPRDHYRADAADNELGGGDDINTWDSETSWEQFYPRPKEFFGCRR